MGPTSWWKSFGKKMKSEPLSIPQEPKPITRPRSVNVQLLFKDKDNLEVASMLKALEDMKTIYHPADYSILILDSVIEVIKDCHYKYLVNLTNTKKEDNSGETN